MASKPAPTPSGAAGAGAAGPVQCCGTPGKPCAGQGMSDQAKIDQYGGEMAKLRTDWKTLTLDQRRAALQKAVDDATPAGMPKPKVKFDSTMGPNTNGELHFQTWDVAINQARVSKNELTEDEFTKLSGTLYHETRHAEQWYLIARRDAANGMTADQIAAQRSIPLAVAKEAVKNPLKKDDPRRACADALYESVYGKDAAARNATLKALGPNAAATQAAATKANASAAAYNTINANPAATAAQKQAALTQAQSDYAAWQAAKATQDANYAAYRALPEEADAWDAGDRAMAATKSKLTPPPPPPKKGP